MKVTFIENTKGKKWLDKEGRIHCDDGPAEIYGDGTEIWYYHGVVHRDDGPAIIYCGNKKTVEHFLYGKFVPEIMFRLLTESPLDELPLYMGLGYEKFIAKRFQEEGIDEG